jgi:hypothetical protein
MRDRAIGVLFVLVVGACTNGPGGTSSTPTESPGVSPARPAIEDLVDVRGELINVSSLQGRIAFSSGTGDIHEDIYTVNADGSGLERLTTR